MPKKRVNYDSQLSFQLENKLRLQLVALAYLRGDRGSYAGVCRQYLHDGVTEAIRKFGPADRARFDEILMNVTIADTNEREMAATVTE
jgi:hypothetical protein